jgi:hypothetical protein
MPGRWQFAPWRRLFVSKATYDYESLLHAMLYSIEEGLPWDGTESVQERKKKRDSLLSFARTRAGTAVAHAIIAIQEVDTPEAAQNLVLSTFGALSR